MAANNFPAFPDDTPEHTNQTGMIAVVEEQPERTQQLCQPIYSTSNDNNNNCHRVEQIKNKDNERDSR